MMELTREELEAIVYKAAAAGAQAGCEHARQPTEQQADKYGETFTMMRKYNDAKFCLAHTSDESIKASTELKMQHIDAALEEIKRRREAQKRSVEYEAFELYFMQGMTYEAIAEKLYTSKNTPRRWVGGILNELTPMLYGV
mgnify:FL=1